MGNDCCSAQGHSKQELTTELEMNNSPTKKSKDNKPLDLEDENVHFVEGLEQKEDKDYEIGKLVTI